MAISDWSDEELTRRLREAVEAEAGDLACVLERLAEFDRRRLQEKTSQPALFDYCVRTLGYSEGAAARRIAAARLSRDCRAVLDLVRGRRVHLAGLYLIAPLAKTRPVALLLPLIEGKTKREVERLVAELSPAHAPRKDIIRFLPGPAIAHEADSSASLLSLSPPQQEPERPAADSARRETSAVPPPAAAAETPLVRVSFNASATFLGKLETVRGLLRHQRPTGSLEAVLDAALDAFLTLRDPLRPLGSGRNAASHARHIPRWARYKVWIRDAGRCAFIDQDGRRCENRERLQLDHVKPWALGGRSDDPDNLRLLCRAHNLLAARLAFGDGPTPACR